MVPLLKQLLKPSDSRPADEASPASVSDKAPIAIFATQLRAESTFDRFLEAAAGAGLWVHQIEVQPTIVFHNLVTEEDSDMVVLHRITVDPQFE